MKIAEFRPRKPATECSNGFTWRSSPGDFFNEGGLQAVR